MWDSRERPEYWTVHSLPELSEQESGGWFSRAALLSGLNAELSPCGRSGNQEKTTGSRRFTYRVTIVSHELQCALLQPGGKLCSFPRSFGVMDCVAREISFATNWCESWLTLKIFITNRNVVLFGVGCISRRFISSLEIAKWLKDLRVAILRWKVPGSNPGAVFRIFLGHFMNENDINH